MKPLRLGLTFNDVLLVPKRTPLNSRSEAEVTSKFTRNIPLKVPLVSANMATVTEHKMAIAMAREGGLGVIHQFDTIEQQVEEVRKVKRSTSFIIDNPISINKDCTIQEAIDLMQNQGVTSLLVKNGGGNLVGIFTHRDYLFEQDLSKKITEVMTPQDKLIVAEYGISMDKAKHLLHEHRIEKLPLIENGQVKGLITTQDISKLEYWPNATRDEKGRLRVGAAVGVKDTLERAKALIDAGADVIILDIAHCHSDLAIRRIREFKALFPKVDLMAGNIATADAARELIEAGADGLKVGIGPSPVCLDGETSILMKGFTIKKIKDIKIGDYVITHKGRARKVTKIFKRPYSGKFVSIKVRGCPGWLVMTEEHPVLATLFDVNTDKIAKNGPKYYFFKPKHNKGLQWVPANKLKKFDVVVLPKIIPERTENKVFDLAEIFPGYNFDSNSIWSNKIGFNPNDISHPEIAKKFGTTPRIIGNIVHGGNSFDKSLNKKVNLYLNRRGYSREISPIKIKRYIKLDEDFSLLLGYYLAEGFMGGYENNRHVGFCFHRNEIEYHNDIIRLVNRVFGYLGTGIVYDKRHKAATINIYNNIIAKFIEKLVPGIATTKIIPECILKSGKGQLKNILIGMIRGDGTIKDYRRVKYKTSSISLAYQVSQILNQLGYLPTITKVPPSKKSRNYAYLVNISGEQYDKFSAEMSELNIKAKTVKTSKQQIWEDKNYIYLAVEQVSVFENSTEVYNLEVEDDNSYVANRIITHNCTTRIIAGSGIPQLTAVMDVVEVAKIYNVPVCADGGMKNPGDVAKAIAAGASSIFSGFLFAGTEEAPGIVLMKDGKRYKKYMGSASYDSGHERKEVLERRKVKDRLDMFVEGVSILIDYKGPVEDVINGVVKGLQSAISYCGARNIWEMQKNAEFIQITQSAWEESKAKGNKLNE